MDNRSPDNTPPNWTNETEKASNVLDQILESEAVSEETELDLVTVAEARAGERVLDVVSERTRTRVLFVTQDVDVLEEGSTVNFKYQKLAQVFDEIHILLMLGGKKEPKATRVLDNMWVYQSYGKSWWSKALHARSFAKENLIFNDAVRPDVVIATDAFYAGLAGYFIAKAFKRPFQIHLNTNPYDINWYKENDTNKKLLKFANFVLKRTKSVRVTVETTKADVQLRFKKIKDIELLPHYYNFKSFNTGEEKFNVHTKYPQYTFIILTQGSLTADSALHDTFAATRNILKNPRMGMIVVADGPAKDLFKKKIELLGIEKSVVFLSKTDDLVSYYKSADVLIETDTTQRSEENILRAIGANLPIVAYETALRNDLLEDGESAFLCEDKDSYCMYQKLNKFLNSTSLRTKFKQREKEISTERLHEDEGAYYRSMRDSIEQAILVD